MALLTRQARGAALLLAALLLLPSPGARSEEQIGNEYAIKAVFLYNFCRFIDWPERAFASADEPMIIGVIGEDPFGPKLEETVRGEAIRGRRIRVERYRRIGDIGHCHILFVCGSESGRVDDVLGAVAGKNVVTVGETENFLDRGGMIALMADRNRVRLRISPAKLRAASLTPSSKLLRVAEIAL